MSNIHNMIHYKCYLMTQLTRWNYSNLQLSYTLDEIVQEYKLQDKATEDGHVYIDIRQ